MAQDDIPTAPVDLTLVLTAHDETLVAGPSLRAANRALAVAQEAGITTEALVTLDNATPECAAWFARNAKAPWRLIEMEEGDLGRVRNAIVPQTAGRFIAFLDADDLFSDTWLRDGVRALEAAADRGHRAIAHPELNWLFDGAHSVFFKPAQDDPLFSPWHFYFSNYYDSLCMAPREAHLDIPYVSRDIPAGLSFQDWQFSVETIAAGWRHVNAPGTIIFKRRRDSSLVTESRSRRALLRAQPALRLDRVADLGALPDAPSIPAPPVAKPGLLGRLRRARPELPTPPMPETPHYGPVMAARIARAAARQGHGARKRAYKATAPWFDTAYYLARYPDIAKVETIDPLAHYLRAGWKEGRDPAPWFGTNAYQARYPEVAKSGLNPFHHYVTRGAAKGYLPNPFDLFADMAEAMGHDPAVLDRYWRARQSALRARLETGDLGAAVTRMATIEPLVTQGWAEALQVKLPALHSPRAVTQSATIYRLARAAGFAPASHVICVNRARFGAAPRIEGHLARSLAARVGAENVLVITTDAPGKMPAGKFPKGVRHVDFAALVPDLRGDLRQRMLAEFLRALGAERAFNVNARLMWDMMSPYGTALSASIRLYAVLLCNEVTPMGFATGYPLRRVYRHFEQHAGFLTDSLALQADLLDRHGPTEPHRIGVLPNPVDPAITPAKAPAQTPDRRPQIFWAGRFDAQKRVDLAFDIARALPEVDFRFWGAEVMGAAPLPAPPDNVTLEGAYERFADLPLSECDLWLYTSGWDGVPSILLEVGLTGVPILASGVGGVPEILSPEMCMDPAAGPEDWARALRTRLTGAETARRAAAALRDRLLAARTGRAHETALWAFLEATGETTGPDPSPAPDPGPVSDPAPVSDNDPVLTPTPPQIRTPTRTRRPSPPHDPDP